MGHAIFAEVNGVHFRASGVDSGTNNVICFLFVFESSMVTFFFFDKSDFYKNYNKICKILIFFRQICLKKVG